MKTTEDRFALSLTETLNEMAAEGWEYVRAETLPCLERKGLTGSQQTYQNILIFKRLEAAAMPLDRTTSRPIAPVADPDPDPQPEFEEMVEAYEEPEAPRLSSRPPEGGVAPSIRALDD